MSAFPSAKDQESLMAELRQDRFFDVFEFNAPTGTWNCFLCNHPERAPGFMQENQPLMEGQLKEKRNKWLIFRRWRTRYFTLSGAHLTYKESVCIFLSPWITPINGPSMIDIYHIYFKIKKKEEEGISILE